MNLFMVTTIVFAAVGAFLLCVCLILLVMLRQTYDQLRDASEPMLPPRILGMWVREPDADEEWVWKHGEQF